MNTRAIAIVCTGSFATGCAPTVLPPPQAPAPLPPPVAVGDGQVAIDTVGSSPAVVEEITGHYEGMTAGGYGVDGLTYRTVCRATPCVASLEPGDHDLRFTSLVDAHDGGTATITAAAQPTAFRYAMGHSTDPSVGWILPFTLGDMATITGLTLLAIGHADGITPQGMPTSSNVTPAGEVTLAVGVGLTAFALYLWSKERGSVQAGTGYQWPLR